MTIKVQLRAAFWNAGFQQEGEANKLANRSIRLVKRKIDSIFNDQSKVRYKYLYNKKNLQALVQAASAGANGNIYKALENITQFVDEVASKIMSRSERLERLRGNRPIHLSDIQKATQVSENIARQATTLEERKNTSTLDSSEQDIAKSTARGRVVQAQVKDTPLPQPKKIITQKTVQNSPDNKTKSSTPKRSMATDAAAIAERVQKLQHKFNLPNQIITAVMSNLLRPYKRDIDIQSQYKKPTTMENIYDALIDTAKSLREPSRTPSGKLKNNNIVKGFFDNLNNVIETKEMLLNEVVKNAALMQPNARCSITANDHRSTLRPSYSLCETGSHPLSITSNTVSSVS